MVLTMCDLCCYPSLVSLVLTVEHTELNGKAHIRTYTVPAHVLVMVA